MNKVSILLSLTLFACFTVKSQNVIHVTDYKELFDTVQKLQFFSDQKAFVDFVPKYNQTPNEILSKYRSVKSNEDFDLYHFITNNFDTAFVDTAAVLNHINYLWDFLTRNPVNKHKQSSLIPLKYPYIVPGGRFREIYYWDSYFTMLGLEVAGKTELIKNMIDNFAYLIRQYGHIPNGNRSYYLSRSQPPFLSLMIQLYADLPQTDKKQVYQEYRDVLEKEYEFWMHHTQQNLKSYDSENRVVMMDKGIMLNRYWDNLSTPRPESYLYDIETKKHSQRTGNIYRDIRAAAESGWDFSSRWFSNEQSLISIQTTHIIPIDLNCLLYFEELMLSEMYDNDKSVIYKSASEKRKKQILELLWSENQKYFFDFDYVQKCHTKTFSLAAVYPLFFKIVDEDTAAKVAKAIEKNFLKEGGLVTTLNHTGQQWDYPNGWPPLQWIGYKALKNYGFEKMAKELAQRWINLNVKVYLETNKMMEKYDVVDINRKGGGGEYKLQDGFGWTNGVFLKLWDELHP